MVLPSSHGASGWNLGALSLPEKAQPLDGMTVSPGHLSQPYLYLSSSVIVASSPSHPQSLSV